MADDAEIDYQDLQNQLASLDVRFPDNALVIYSPNEEQRQFLGNLLENYVNASPKQQYAIYEAFRNRMGLSNLLVGYVFEAAKQARATRDKFWLRTGLVAASIAEALGRVDYRDRLLALAELYVTAEEAGLEPQAEFASAGLADFSTYAVVRERRNRPSIMAGTG